MSYKLTGKLLTLMYVMQTKARTVLHGDQRTFQEHSKNIPETVKEHSLAFKNVIRIRTAVCYRNSSLLLYFTLHHSFLLFSILLHSIVYCSTLHRSNLRLSISIFASSLTVSQSGPIQSNPSILLYVLSLGYF